MLPYDVRNFSDAKREEIALRVQAAEDFNLPKLKFWNYDLCKRHRRGWMEISWNRDTRQEEKHLVTTKPFLAVESVGFTSSSTNVWGIMWLYHA